MSNNKDLGPPIAKIVPKRTNIHGKTLIDDYFWLRDKNNQEVIDYLKAENKYTESKMELTKELQNTLYEEMISRIKETDSEVPKKLGNYYYYSRTEKGKQYSIFCRKKGNLENREEILLDINQLAEGKEYCAIGILEISPDHTLMAYGVDFTGYEDYTLYIMDLDSHTLLSDIIPELYYGLEWSNDNKTLYYIKTDNAKRPYRVYRHTLGNANSQDELIFQENDETFNVAIYSTMDKNYIVILTKSSNTSECYYFNKNNPVDGPVLLYSRITDIEYYIEHRNDLFYITTNHDAINFKLVSVPVSDPKPSNWQEVIPHDPEVYLSSIEIFKDHMAIYKRINGLKSLSILNFTTNNIHDVKFDEEIYTVNYRTGDLNLDYDSNILRYEYSSMITPSSIYDLNMDNFDKKLMKQDEIRGYNSENYVSKREVAITDDNERIYISIVYKKDLDLSKPQFLFLNGYGSYGLSLDPNFNSRRVSLLDRGIIIALAHIRGGGEKGKPWYNSGKLLKKKNTFKDFIKCAEHLINKNYTSKDQLIISGGSAGGLLMATVTNMRPDLFKIVIADVPFVDVVNTMLDETIPLTVPEFNEWGNPKIRKYFDYIFSYSPYDNIGAKDYPTMLVTAGLNDPRVHYWEPAKYTAKLRAMKTNDNLLLLKTNMGAGHGGASGRYDFLKEIAFDYAFIIKHLDLNF